MSSPPPRPGVERHIDFGCVGVCVIPCEHDNF